MKRLTLSLAVVFVAGTVFAQQPQIPTLQVCNGTKVTGSGNVFLSKRVQPGATGIFDIRIEAGCDNVGSDGFPAGSISMRFSLSDSTITDLRVTSIEQMTTTGKHTPTMYLNGRCLANGGRIPCHIWLMLADNKSANANGTADVVGVLVLDKKGTRLTYGTGPLRSGDIAVAPTGF